MISARQILLVEDDADIREALADVLRQAGYSVACAGDGKQGLDQLQRGPRPDVILLDLMMPVMDGLAFRAAQLDRPDVAHIPVVVLTADGRYHERHPGPPVDAALAKPFDVGELLATIARLVEPLQPAA